MCYQGGALVYGMALAASEAFELGGGLCILLGLFTRWAAIALAGAVPLTVAAAISAAA